MKSDKQLNHWRIKPLMDLLSKLLSVILVQLSCEQCGGEIPPRLARKACATYQPRFCSQQCALQWRRESGWNQHWSAIANAAQQAFKAEYGEVPGYEQRRAALQRPDRPNKRKREVPDCSGTSLFLLLSTASVILTIIHPHNAHAPHSPACIHPQCGKSAPTCIRVFPD